MTDSGILSPWTWVAPLAIALGGCADAAQGTRGTHHGGNGGSEGGTGGIAIPSGGDGGAAVSTDASVLDGSVPDASDPSPAPDGGNVLDASIDAAALDGDLPPAFVPPLMPRRQIAAYGSHTCALSEAGSITCWGNNERGQTDAPSGTGFVQLALGTTYSCALRDDGTFTCWGDMYDGQDEALGLVEVARIDSTNRAICLLFADGKSGCWGDNIRYFLTGPDTPLFTEIAGARLYFACGLTEQREMWCQGLQPSEVPEGSDYVAISAGEFNVCGLHENGTLSCWDARAFGAPPPYDDFVQVSAGTDFACALRASGAIVCWGDNTYGELASPSGTDFTWISAGQTHSCALRTNGKAVCWGSNGSGQLDPIGEFAP